MNAVGATLRERLARARILVAPGVSDALTANLVEQAGFEAAYVSGASIAYTRLGRPDIGLVSMAEVADVITLIRERVGLWLVVDADTGYGNALNVQRTVARFERAGANAMQLEDQTFPKRCGHLSDKSLISSAEMVGKIRAALDARASSETLVVARTDAVAVEGFDAAIERAVAYADAGADVIFVEAPKTREQLASVAAALGGRAPLMANMVEGGRTPILPAGELEALGFSLVIFPGGAVRAMAHAARDYYATLAEHGTSAPFAGRMFDFDQLNEVVGTPAMIERGRQYEPAAARAGAAAADPVGTAQERTQ